MAEHEEIVQHPDFKDRKTGLVVFGILEIILGGFCTLMTLVMIISSAFIKSSAAPTSVSMILPGILLYALLAVWLNRMGIGSIMARRWARALLLVVSWLWLISGISGLILMLMFMPGMYDKMAQSGQIPQGIAVIIKHVMLGFMAVVYAIIPGALVLFYRNRNVKATCEVRDPQLRWTDICPLPVLAVSIMYEFGAGSMLLMGFFRWAIPFFGFILRGMAGAGVTLVVILLFAYVAWGTYKLNIKAWWCAVLMTIVWTLSTGITFSRVSLWDLYEKMNFPAQQLEIMRQFYTPLYSAMALLFFGVMDLGFLADLLYTKRYFASPATQEPGL
jgi:hypothetical protein